MGERTRYEPGTFCWVGLATSDPGSAKTLYTSLLGWEAEDLSAGVAGTYTMLRCGGREVAILYRQQPEARAAVFREPFDVLDHGRVAAIRDPTGAIVSLWQPRARVGATLVNDVGALCRNELATTGVERAKPFFAELLGWEYETDDGGYVSIKNVGSLNGGMREQSERERDIPPNWLPYFTVENTENAALQAEQLGGYELMPTTEIRTGRCAVLADPQGAAFAVFEGVTDP